ncbi:MAG: hypothetical protein ACRCWJ_18620 [Casimicrobium sp.]
MKSTDYSTGLTSFAIAILLHIAFLFFLMKVLLPIRPSSTNSPRMYASLTLQPSRDTRVMQPSQLPKSEGERKQPRRESTRESKQNVEMPSKLTWPNSSPAIKTSVDSIAQPEPQTPPNHATASPTPIQVEESPSEPSVNNDSKKTTEFSPLYNRSSIRDLIHSRAPTVPESIAPSPRESERLGRDVANAKRADCANKYAVNGLLAIPLIAADHLRESGCRFSR